MIGGVGGAEPFGEEDPRIRPRERRARRFRERGEGEGGVRRQVPAPQGREGPGVERASGRGGGGEGEGGVRGQGPAPQGGEGQGMRRASGGPRRLVTASGRRRRHLPAY